MNKNVSLLISYALDNELLDNRDVTYAFNNVCHELNIEPTEGFKYNQTDLHINEILNNVVAEIKFDTPTHKELLKTKLIGLIIERPSHIENKFYNLYKSSPKEATDWYYKFASDINYVKTLEVKKNIVYKSPSKYGDLDITINLSKPEKSTKEIEMLKQQSSTNFPPCFLCKEHENLYGSLKNPDRSNHRIINLKLNSIDWYLQYSPYAYFNEHSILLKDTHSDMKINEDTFKNLVEFVDMFPHYMVGSNADLPIVGGSMLTHDHYQCGNYEFPIFKAKDEFVKTVNNVELFKVNWPMHTIKLVSKSKEELIKLSTSILDKWKNYNDANIISNTGDISHNTITPILRYHNNAYEFYLILRNNKTSEEHPTGIFHVDKSRHHIKQENIGLIEAIGLAVLPARLKTELNEIAEGKVIDHHFPLVQKLKENNPNQPLEFLYQEVGNIFTKCLEDCGVFKYDESKYIEFIEGIND